MPVQEIRLDAMDRQATLAKHDPAFCLIPGLFRSLKRGDYKKEKLHIRYVYNKNERLTFMGYEPLGVDDMRVLQGLVALSGSKQLTLDIKNESSAGMSLRKKMELKESASSAMLLVVDDSFYNLAKTIGYTTNSGSVLKKIKESIVRLWAVSVLEESPQGESGYRIVSSLKIDKKQGQLVVALNPRITEKILGKSLYTRINMDEVRQLKSDPARLLHQRLCAIISQGQKRKILPDTLMGYIWPDPIDGSAKRRRMQTLRKALAEIVATGAWEVEPGYFIKRKGDFKKKKAKKSN